MKYNLKGVRILAVILSMFIVFSSCKQQIAKEDKILIAISKDYTKPDKLSNYYKWLLKTDSTIEAINLYKYSVDSAMIMLEKCSGLLISGGADVFPGRYGKIDDTARCGEFDLHRDTVEFAAIDKALEMQLPIMGICRGMQIFNISQGGSLFIDIPTDFDTTVSHRTTEGEHDWHAVEINQASMLYKLTKGKTDSVYSHHHQGIDELASNLRIVSRSADGLPEAVEWKEAAGKNYFLAVQFHPERMNYNSPLSGNLAREFVKEVIQYKQKK